MRADLAKLTEFAHLMGEPARDILPSGYLHALVFPAAMSVMVQEDFPLPLLGMIHLRNQVQHFAPVLFSDELSVRAWARDLAGHRIGTQVQIVAEIHTADGTELLWRGVSTYLAKGVFLPGLDKPTPAAPRVEFAPPAPTAQWQLGVDTGRAYAAVSGDFNPIHLSVLSAKALGLRRSIAHGMYAAARVLATVPQAKPHAFSWDISFDSPVFLPATVSLEVLDHRTDDGVWLVRSSRPGMRAVPESTSAEPSRQAKRQQARQKRGGLALQRRTGRHLNLSVDGGQGSAHGFRRMRGA